MHGRHLGSKWGPSLGRGFGVTGFGICEIEIRGQGDQGLEQML